jgi:hypothetical protein
MTGARFAAALHLSGDVFGGLAIDGVADPAERSSDAYAHIGAFLGFGAPYTLDWVGVSGEAGTSLFVKGDRTGQPPAVSPYAKGTLVLQLPREHGIRPYLAISYLGSEDSMNRTALVDIGLAWNQW